MALDIELLNKGSISEFVCPLKVMLQNVNVSKVTHTITYIIATPSQMYFIYHNSSIIFCPCTSLLDSDNI